MLPRTTSVMISFILTYSFVFNCRAASDKIKDQVNYSNFINGGYVCFYDILLIIKCSRG